MEEKYFRKLSNDVKIPCIGYGTWKIPEVVAEKTVYEALRVGYRHIDTAAIYGNEASVGKAVKNSGIAREKIFLTSKLWNREQGYESTLKAFNKSLFDLQTDHLDLYLIHWPVVKGHENDWQKMIMETWKAFEKLYKDGYVRAIGVSNFMIHHLQILLDNAEILPMVDQIEIHPGLNHESIVKFLSDHDILAEGWSPLAHGSVLKMGTLQSISQKYNRSIAQICLRWAVQKGIIPLPKSTNLDRIRENLQVFDFTIDDKDMKILEQLPQMTDTLGANPDKSIY